MKPLDQFSIRKQNINKLLALLSQRESMTRQELATASGLSLMTVTNLVDLLKAHQVLSFAPIEQAERRGGRKAELISLCSGHHAWLVVDISGQRFRFSLLSFNRTLMLEGAEGESAPGEAYLTRLERFLADTRRQVEQHARGWRLPGISVVTPGPYEITSDTVNNQRLPELNSIRIKALFRRHLGQYEYYVDEDVKFAVRAFSAMTDRPECELLYYLYIGEGVGGAAVHSGNMLRGLNAVAGDAGQLRDASGAAYETRLSLRTFSEAVLPQGCAGQENPLQLLRDQAAADPDAYCAALRRFACVAADMLHSVLWMLDPSHVIIDCRYAAPFEDVFLASLRDALKERFSASSRALPLLAAPPQGMSSVLRGAIQVLQREWVNRIVSA